MLVAKVRGTGDRIFAASHPSGHSLRSTYPLGNLICPHCDQVVFPRERQGFVLHFVHQHPCTSSIERHPESPEHEQGKAELVKYLRTQIQGDTNKTAKIEVEHRLPQCGENGRIADVALVYENGNILICECQLARITVDELERRTRDYYSIGADVIWFLGGEADTTENRTWLRSVFGAVGKLDFTYTAIKTEPEG
jgi:competence CoiA-like predicted nuclease